jgi:hypothetical protein
MWGTQHRYKIKRSETSLSGRISNFNFSFQFDAAGSL